MYRGIAICSFIKKSGGSFVNNSDLKNIVPSLLYFLLYPFFVVAILKLNDLSKRQAQITIFFIFENTFSVPCSVLYVAPLKKVRTLTDGTSFLLLFSHFLFFFSSFLLTDHVSKRDDKTMML